MISVLSTAEFSDSQRRRRNCSLPAPGSSCETAFIRCSPQLSQTNHGAFMLSSIQRSILVFMWSLFVANRKIIQDEFFPADKDGSVTRDALRRLTAAGLIDRIEIKPNGFLTSCCPVYMPNERGCALLAAESGDMRFLLNGTTPKRLHQHFDHFLRVTRLLSEYRKGFAAQSTVELTRLILEHQWINPEAAPAARRKLLTTLGKGKGGGSVVCAPDAATVIKLLDAVRLDLWEFECGSDTPSRIAAKKTPGYHQFQQSGVWRELFPCAQLMRVIAVCPNEGFREALRRALRDKDNLGKELWWCVNVSDIRRDGGFILGEAVFYPVDGDPRPLVRTPPSPPAALVPAGSEGGGARLPEVVESK